MKISNLNLYKHQGFTLIEALVAFLIFALVLLANGGLLKDMLKVQKDSNEQMIVADILQERLLSATLNPNVASQCQNLDTTNFTFANTQYFVACAIVSSTDAGTGMVVEWPALAASSVSQAQAQSCLSGAVTSDCFVVGK